ncbi:MAG TPA: pyruvate dehydrogenase (acetyl-transferring) E1 component subunit alpha, partial [Actinomycetota bacterium]|nr:pyruvate dehydrogenase (acetyl-transferring) E1 component subunit alpha [Actinomycetota bacterium]
IERYRRWLEAEGHADAELVTTWEQEAEGWVADVRGGLIATEPPPTEWMFDWTFAEPTAELRRQRTEALGG